MKFEIKEVLVAGDRVIVRGEVTGTPAGDLFGVPHTAGVSGSWSSIFRPSKLPRLTTSKIG
jgi:predicted ester cyclase